jgi:hypothetical protein
MEKHLDLDIGIDGNNIVINVCEPESGECAQLLFRLDQATPTEFCKRLGSEVYSWISLWMDENESPI